MSLKYSNIYSLIESTHRFLVTIHSSQKKSKKNIKCKNTWNKFRTIKWNDFAMAYKCVENICDKRFLCQRDLLNVPRVLLYFSSIILRTFLHLLPFLFAAVCSTKNGWQNVLWNFHNFQLETSSALCLLYLVCLNAFHLNIMSIMSIMITNMGKNGGAYILSRWDSIDLCLFMTVLYYWQN